MPGQRAAPVLICLLSLVLPATEEPAFSLDTLRATAAATDHVRVAFEQIKDLELFDRPVVTPGVLEISRPEASVRWEFQGRAVLLLRHGQLHRYRADGSRDHIRGDPASKALEGQMQALLSGDWRSLERLFDVAVDADERRIRLMPGDPELARYVSGVEVVYGDDLAVPASLEISAPGGDRTRYEFASPQRPGEIELARFTGP